jgi:HK97 family phage major capsid protein
MAKVTLFELKEKVATIQAEIAAVSEWIAEKAADPNTPMEEINLKKTRRDELTARYGLLKEEHDSMEEAQRTSLAVKQGSGTDEESVRTKAKASFYKAALTGEGAKKAYEGLGGIPAQNADLGYGDNLLPVNMSKDLLTEPVEENSLRRIEPASQVTGLSEPILMFDIEDADLEDVTDKETAKEIGMSAGTSDYGRFKTKITATVKDTVLHGTETNLVATIENALRSGIAIKEKIDAFRTTPNTAKGHMSFYLNNIKQVTGPNLIQAIINAWADLPDAFATKASCVMRKSDYYAAIMDLANNDNLWGKKPEDVIGIPAVFNDRAVTPIVGDFGYSRQNYDIGAIYETDKDAKKGEYYFVLTAWGDHRIRLKSAFRLATVVKDSGTGNGNGTGDGNGGEP